MVEPLRDSKGQTLDSASKDPLTGHCVQFRGQEVDQNEYGLINSPSSADVNAPNVMP